VGRLGLVVGVVGVIGSDSGRVGCSKSVLLVVVRLGESPSDERRAEACSSRARLARRRRPGHYCGQLSRPISGRVREGIWSRDATQGKEGKERDQGRERDETRQGKARRLYRLA
jgi:hypothetical protein